MSEHSLSTSASAATHAIPAPVGNALVRLDELGLIAVTGDEAGDFLHKQLTNDVEHLAPDRAQLAGYCSPKGRLLATFLMWRTPDAFMIQLPREIQPAIQKRLQMFVLRAKVKLADAGADTVSHGLIGAEALASFPSMPQTAYATVHDANGTLVRLPDSDGQPRAMWIAARDNADAAASLARLAGVLPMADAAAWTLSQIRAGIPQVSAATQEQFVPQMINYELIGGVNFKKGCYPGQEIVARSQYLGKLKRRMVLAQVEDAGAAAGMEVFSSADPDQPCGMVVNAAPNGAGGAACLVEIKLAALEDGSVHLGAPSGPVLRFADLPYALAEPA